MQRSLILAAALTLALAPAAWAEQHTGSTSGTQAEGTTSGPASPHGTHHNGEYSHKVTGNENGHGGHVGAKGAAGAESGSAPAGGRGNDTTK